MSFSNQENSSQTAPDLISSNKDYANVPAFSFGSSKARKRFSWEKNLSMKKVENSKFKIQIFYSNLKLTS